MPKFKWKGRAPRKHKAQPKQGSNAALSRAQKNIYRQAALALLTLVLTMVIVFAMTSAWYTNIVQTSGLVFQAEAWGFDGTITVEDTPIVAAPGEDGTVNLEVKNDGDITAISVNISKAKMVPQMQQRMYFYVDTQLKRNGETMERVYLNNRESYTYTVFNNGRLTLTEQLHNDAQIKWMWVYDVLGYYVLAEYDAATDTMDVIEYLRPIEYDYDASTSTFVNDGEDNLSLVLSTVDGTKTVEQFLLEVSQKDGYSGVINMEKKYANGYYEIDASDVGVDGDRYGVFAYLCNYAEIEEATQFDTALGAAAYEAENNPAYAGDKSEFTFEAKMTLSAQKSDNTVVNVSTLAGLQEAVNNTTADVIKLNSNVTLTDNSLTIPKDTRVMIDLNGHTIGRTGEGNTIEAEPGSSLTLINGSLTGADKDATEKVIQDYAVYAVGAEVILSNVKVKDYTYGFYVGDHLQNNTLDSRIYIVGSELTTEDYTIYAQGNGLASEQKTQIIIENSKLTSDSMVITGNGTVTADGSGRWGTDIQIISSTITSNVSADLKPGAGIYQPQKDSTLTLYKSTVSGYTGVAVKGGSVSIIDSTISGLGAYKAADNNNKSGFTDTGDAVYLETNYSYPIEVEISQTTDAGAHTELKSTYSYALQLSDTNTTTTFVQISGGTFTQGTGGTTADGSAYTIKPLADCISPYIADGYALSGTTVAAVTQSTT